MMRWTLACMLLTMGCGDDDNPFDVTFPEDMCAWVDPVPARVSCVLEARTTIATNPADEYTMRLEHDEWGLVRQQTIDDYVVYTVERDGRGRFIEQISPGTLQDTVETFTWDDCESGSYGVVRPGVNATGTFTARDGVIASFELQNHQPRSWVSMVLESEWVDGRMTSRDRVIDGVVYDAWRWTHDSLPDGEVMTLDQYDADGELQLRQVYTSDADGDLTTIETDFYGDGVDERQQFERTEYETVERVDVDADGVDDWVHTSTLDDWGRTVAVDTIWPAEPERVRTVEYVWSCALAED